MLIADLFKDPAHAESYKRQGYVAIPLLNAEEITSLTELYARLENEAKLEAGFYASVWSENKNYRQAVHAAAIKALGPKVSQHLNNIKPVLGAFQVKHSGSGTQLQAHQDWSFVDEPENDTVLIWCPLVDVNRQNGNLQVVPGSQHLRNYVRGRFFDAPFRTLDNILPQLLVDVPLRAGEAVFIHTRLIHASPPNTSNQKRIAVSMVAAPDQAELYHWVLDKNTTPASERKIPVTADFFGEYSCFDPLENYPSTLSRPHTNEPMEREQFLSAIAGKPLSVVKNGLHNLFGLLKR